jgi:hypothetical protein
MRKYLLDKEELKKLACSLVSEWAQYGALVAVFGHKVTKIVNV